MIRYSEAWLNEAQEFLSGFGEAVQPMPVAGPIDRARGDSVLRAGSLSESQSAGGTSLGDKSAVPKLAGQKSAVFG